MRLNLLQSGFKNQKGSALLLSFFMMTMLILVAISVSILVIRDLATVRTIIAGEQGFYSAEGITEISLLQVNQNLPGFESSFNLGSASTNILALDSEMPSTVPCDSQGDEWRKLAKNESIQIPLFYQYDADGNVEKISLFSVEFYVGDENGEPVTIAPVSSLLRWKVLGLNSGRTEAMSEYIPLISGKNSPTNPSVFGTLSDGSLDSAYSSGKSFISIYGDVSIKFRVYPISEFLAGHSYSYLVLTNVITGSDYPIYFKFVSNDKAVCEYAKITSTGTDDLNSIRRELVTLVKEGENLPVFDFVLYHTSGIKTPIPDVTLPSIPDYEWF